MKETMTPQDYAAFLESLKVNNEGPEEMHDIPLDADLSEISEKPDEGARFSNLREAEEFIEYLLERCRRAESNAKPSDLAEQVKAAVRVGMDAVQESEQTLYGNTKPHKIVQEFRRLSEAATEGKL